MATSGSSRPKRMRARLFQELIPRVLNSKDVAVHIGRVFAACEIPDAEIGPSQEKSVGRHQPERNLLGAA